MKDEMSVVRDIADKQKVWTNTRVTCSACKKQWIATHHYQSFALECPDCHQMQTIRKAQNYFELFAALCLAFSKFLYRLEKALRCK